MLFIPCKNDLFLQQAAVCRCSQPLSGFSARCLEDESMLQAISKANHNSRFVYVMDTRPKVAAQNKLSPAHQKNERTKEVRRMKSERVIVFVYCS